MVFENYYGILGLVVLILDVWAMVSVINSGKDTGTKVLWVVLILLLPVLGFIAWLLAGPKSS
jgi:succinate dehydrogenase/fumarate reductase cytochrome b subunit